MQLKNIIYSKAEMNIQATENFNMIQTVVLWVCSTWFWIRKWHGFDIYCFNDKTNLFQLNFKHEKCLHTMNYMLCDALHFLLYKALLTVGTTQ